MAPGAHNPFNPNISTNEPANPALVRVHARAAAFSPPRQQRSVAASDTARRARGRNARGGVVLRRARERRPGLVDKREREALRCRRAAHVHERAAHAHREAAVDACLVAFVAARVRAERRELSVELLRVECVLELEV